MFLTMDVMAELYKKIKSNEATEAERRDFYSNLAVCSFETDYVVEKLEQMIQG
ncbi:MAG: hypothetical protein LUE29_09770 [Lachnospiraceae bacterium]|nr:hypothetical protein [Lachnospiraceae bacterium]